MKCPSEHGFLKVLWKVSAALLVFACSSVAVADFTVSPAISSAAFSFEPSTIESTPNYYAVGPDITAGFTLAETINFGFYAQYLPGCRGAPELFREHAALFGYGAHFAVHIARQFVAGIRFGTYNYNLVSAGDEGQDVDGRWIGNGIGVGFGLLSPIRSNQSAQINIEYMRPLLSAVDEPQLDDRYLGLLQLNFIFKYGGGRKGSSINRFFNSMFKGWGW